MDGFDLGFIVGLLEGEGSFCLKGGGTKRNVQAQCHMTDLDVLETLRARIGQGRISGPYANGRNRKPRYVYVLAGPAARQVMSLILPYMSKRRSNKIRELINGFDGVKRRTFILRHLKSGKTETTQNLRQWLQTKGFRKSNDSTLWRTLSGQRYQCHGWKRVS